MMKIFYSLHVDWQNDEREVYVDENQNVVNITRHSSRRCYNYDSTPFDCIRRTTLLFYVTACLFCAAALRPWIDTYVSMTAARGLRHVTLMTFRTTVESKSNRSCNHRISKSDEHMRTSRPASDNSADRMQKNAATIGCDNCWKLPKSPKKTKSYGKLVEKLVIIISIGFGVRLRVLYGRDLRFRVRVKVWVRVTARVSFRYFSADFGSFP